MCYRTQLKKRKHYTQIIAKLVNKCFENSLMLNHIKVMIFTLQNGVLKNYLL